MIIRLMGEIFKKYHMFLPELLPFSDNLTLHPRVSNIPTALAYSSIDNPVMFCVFWFGHSMYIEITCCQKSKFNARTTRTQNQKSDLFDSI